MISKIKKPIIDIKSFKDDEEKTSASISDKNYYKDIEKGGFREDYGRRLIWKGERIYLISGGTKTACRINDVDEECRLDVVLENGEHRLISSGEISIRRADEQPAEKM